MSVRYTILIAVMICCAGLSEALTMSKFHGTNCQIVRQGSAPSTLQCKGRMNVRAVNRDVGVTSTSTKTGKQADFGIRNGYAATIGHFDSQSGDGFAAWSCYDMSKPNGPVIDCGALEPAPKEFRCETEWPVYDRPTAIKCTGMSVEAKQFVRVQDGGDLKMFLSKTQDGKSPISDVQSANLAYFGPLDYSSPDLRVWLMGFLAKDEQSSAKPLPAASYVNFNIDTIA